MIQSLRLQRFRSYHDESFEFDTSVNIIVGPNASGKTNLLEAILVLARGSSYRAHDSDLVAFGEPWARIDAFVEGAQRTVKVILEPRPEKTYELGGRTYRRLSMQHELPAVLFEPNHLALLSGPPEGRREYLDELLSQTVPGYGITLRAYRRTLVQRNRLLKSRRAAADELFPWNVRLSELGGRIVRRRVALMQSINEQIGQLYADLSRSNTKVSVDYVAAAPTDQYESVMLHQLESRLPRDIERGFTSFGPHREDFVALFDGRPAGEVASRGETRTFVLGLKIIELQLLEAQRDQAPIVLLDDVFSELDGARRHALATHLRAYQTFITTTDADLVLGHLIDAATIIPTVK